MGIMLINKFLDQMCPINFCPLLRDFGISLPASGSKAIKIWLSHFFYTPCHIVVASPAQQGEEHGLHQSA